MVMKAFWPVFTEAADVLSDLKRFMRVAGLYLLIIILASGGAFVFQNLIAVDEWWAYADLASWQTRGPISMGRPVFALISRLAQSAFPLHPFDTIFFYSSLVIFTFALFRRWSDSPWIKLMLMSLFLTSPLLVEHLHFTVNQIPLAIAFLLLTYWFLTVSIYPIKGARRPAVGVLLSGAVAGALAVTIRNELVFMMSGAGVVEFSRALLQRGGAIRSRILPLLTSMLVTALLAVAIILGSVVVAGSGFIKDGNNGTDQLVRSAEQLQVVATRFLIYWNIFLFKEQYLIPFSVKLLVWAITGIAILQSVLAGDYRRLAVIVVGGLLLSALPLSLGLLTMGYPYLYGAVFPLALYACFLACVAVTAPQRVPGAQAAAFLASALIIAISAASLSAAQVRLSNLNRRDISTMTQILGAIRASGVSDWKVAFLGKYTDGEKVLWGKSREQCSVFQCTQALGPLLVLTLTERKPEARQFILSDVEAASLQPALDALPPGSVNVVRLNRNKFVILLK